MKIPKVKLVFDRKKQATLATAKSPCKGLVQIEVSYDRKRKYLSTGVKLYANQWQERTSTVVNSVNAVDYNSLLTQYIASIIEQIREQAAEGKYDIDKFTLGQKSQSVSLVEYALKFLEEKRAHGVRESTIKTYKIWIRSFERFGGFKDIAAINENEIAKYEQFLVNIGWNANTRGMGIDMLNAILARAARDETTGVTKVIHYKKPPKKPTERKYLSEEQIKAVQNVVLPTKSQNTARDLFMFQCFTGMAYIDVFTLDSTMLTKENGKWFIARKRQKTGVHFRVAVLPPVLAILEKYSFELPKMKYRNYLNSLSLVAQAVGFKLSTHMARHTFATWALRHGVPIEIVSKMLGHTNIVTTQIYAKVLAQEVDAQFERLGKLFT